MRVETSDGVVWFKANSAAHRQEAEATALLARVHPELLPELLAVDPERGWMLTRDAGTRLRELITEERTLRRRTAGRERAEQEGTGEDSSHGGLHVPRQDLRRCDVTRCGRNPPARVRDVARA